jgi:predicted Zn-dependent protease
MMVPVIASGCLLIVPFVTNLIADVHLERGRRSEASGDSDEALSAFRSASGVAAWQPLLEEVIVRFSMRHGLDSVAMEAADEAIARSGGQFRWKELRAEALVDSGRFTDALASYEALTSERPNDSSTWRGLAMALSGLGFDERANDAMDRSVSLMREVAAE